MTTTTTRDPRVRELERRIEELEAHDEATFGRFTTWDWAGCIVFTIVVPLFLVWRWAG